MHNTFTVLRILHCVLCYEDEERTISICRSARCKHDGGGTIAHHSRSWFARSIYGPLRFSSSPTLSGIIVGLGLLQARKIGRKHERSMGRIFFGSVSAAQVRLEELHQIQAQAK